MGFNPLLATQCERHGVGHKCDAATPWTQDETHENTGKRVRKVKQRMGK